MTARRDEHDYDGLLWAESADLASLVDDLDDPEFDRASLCDRWRVRDVVSHLLLGHVTPMPTMVGLIARSGFDVPRASRLGPVRLDSLGGGAARCVARGRRWSGEEGHQPQDLDQGAVRRSSDPPPGHLSPAGSASVDSRRAADRSSRRHAHHRWVREVEAANARAHLDGRRRRVDLRFGARRDRTGRGADPVGERPQGTDRGDLRRRGVHARGATGGLAAPTDAGRTPTDVDGIGHRNGAR